LGQGPVSAVRSVSSNRQNLQTSACGTLLRTFGRGSVRGFAAAVRRVRRFTCTAAPNGAGCQARTVTANPLNIPISEAGWHLCIPTVSRHQLASSPARLARLVSRRSFAPAENSGPLAQNSCSFLTRKKKNELRPKKRIASIELVAKGRQKPTQSRSLAHPWRRHPGAPGPRANYPRMLRAKYRERCGPSLPTFATSHTFPDSAADTNIVLRMARGKGFFVPGPGGSGSPTQVAGFVIFAFRGFPARRSAPRGARQLLLVSASSACSRER